MPPGSVIFDLYELQMRMNLCKSLSLERARLELHHALKDPRIGAERGFWDFAGGIKGRNGVCFPLTHLG